MRVRKRCRKSTMPRRNWTKPKRLGNRSRNTSKNRPRVRNERPQFMQDRQLLVAAVAIVCSIGSLSAQSDQPKIDSSKTKTSESAYGDVQTSQTKYFDEKGVPVKTEKTT